MTDSCTLSRICIDNNLTFINNCIELILNRCIKNFTDMFDSESCIKCVNADTDTLHITLSCMVYTLDTVDVVVEFTLDNRFKVRLHVLTCNFNNICNAVLAAEFHLIYFRSDQCDLVILYLRSSAQSTREPSNSTCMSLRRMISPSNADAKATGISIFVILILISRASREVALNLLTSS